VPDIARLSQHVAAALEELEKTATRESARIPS
jgi:hypothetical protein